MDTLLNHSFWGFENRKNFIFLKGFYFFGKIYEEKICLRGIIGFCIMWGFVLSIFYMRLYVFGVFLGEVAKDYRGINLIDCYRLPTILGQINLG